MPRIAYRRVPAKQREASRRRIRGSEAQQQAKEIHVEIVGSGQAGEDSLRCIWEVLEDERITEAEWLTCNDPQRWIGADVVKGKRRSPSAKFF
jgi:hypothetical protein